MWLYLIILDYIVPYVSTILCYYIMLYCIISHRHTDHYLLPWGCRGWWNIVTQWYSISSIQVAGHVFNTFNLGSLENSSTLLTIQKISIPKKGRKYLERMIFQRIMRRITSRWKDFGSKPHRVFQLINSCKKHGLDTPSSMLPVRSSGLCCCWILEIETITGEGTDEPN